jgi:outer membrane protein assembly factor BamB
MQRLLITLLAASVWAAEQPPVLAASGLAGGVCVFPRAADTTLPLAVARSPGWLVHAQVPAANLDAARKQAAAEGLLATRLWLDAAGAEPPLAERLVDLMVVEALAPADLTEANRDLWLSRLAVRRGRLLFSATAPDAAIRAWLPQARPLTITGRTWHLAIRGPEPGMDVWTHRLHDPANSQVSTDAFIRPAFRTQWLTLPLHEGFWGSVAVSDAGRLAAIGASRTPSVPLTLSVRSLGSGQPLWERTFTWDKPRDKYAGGIYSGRSCLVAHGDELLLARHADVERIDAETGVVRGTIAGPRSDGQIKWMAVADDTVFLLVGDPDAFTTNSLQSRPNNPAGALLAAYDAATGAKRWAHATEGPVDERCIALRDGRIIYHADGVGAVARAVGDGTVQWTTAVAATDQRNDKISDLLSSERLLLLTPEAALFGGRHRPQFTALDPAQGAVLWTKPVVGRGRAVNGVATDGIWYSDAAYDLRTGAKKADQRLPSSGCGPSCVANTRFVTAFGGVQQIGSKEQERGFDAKGPCDIGTLVADGILTSIAGQCHCALEIMGGRAIAGGVAGDPHGEPDGDRLRAGDRTAVLPLAVDARDWPEWRRDARRSAASPAALPATPSLAWTCAAATPIPPHPGQPETAPEFPPAPPVAAGELVWFVDGMGCVRCLDAATGTERWRCLLGSHPVAAPTLAAGILYVSTGDGWLVAFAAQKGTELWRWRAAPRTRLIPAWGRLQSIWPTLGGATVHDGVVYTAAGFQGDNGISVAALDAASGQPRWERHDLGRRGVNLLGQLLVACGRLWIPSGGPIPVGLSLADGSGDPPDMTLMMRQTRRGVLLGDLGEGVLLAGGRRVEPKHGDWSVSERTDGFNFYPFPFAKVPGVLAGTLDGVPLAPAWDDARCITGTPAGRTPSLAIRPLPAVRKGLAAALAKPNHESFTKVQVYDIEAEAVTVPLAPLAVAMAADGIAVAHAKRERKGPTSWHLSVLGTDGKPRWQADLPAQPRFDGLIIDRSGRILVPLMDGSLVAYGTK